MRYDEKYKESVCSNISLAINKLAKCITDTTNIPSIPSDFERSLRYKQYKNGNIKY